MKVYDISLAISKDTPVWPGQPAVEIEPISTLVKDGAAVSKLSFSSHVATHVDAPAHFLAGGKTVEEVALDQLIGPARVLDLTKVTKAIAVSHLKPFNINKGERLLFKTRNSRLLLERDFHSDYVYLSAEAAGYLVDKGVILVGIDYLGIEKKGAVGHPVHKTLLKNKVVVVEGLYLGEVSAGRYQLVCLPLRIVGGDGAPARAVLIRQDKQ